LAEVRKREHYESPSVRRKKKSEAARKRRYNKGGEQLMSLKDKLMEDFKSSHERKGHH